MEVYARSRKILALFESLLSGAQLGRLMLIKENNTRGIQPETAPKPQCASNRFATERANLKKAFPMTPIGDDELGSYISKKLYEFLTN